MENQQKVWNAVAKQWYHFRQKSWSDVGKVLNLASIKWKKGKILDIGCGNCRNLLPFAEHNFECYGIDFSEEMLKHAKEFVKNHKIKADLKQAGAEKLPFKENSFDYAISIAVLHHLNKKQQLQALQEMKRVLKNRGKAIITVWNKWQGRFLFKKKEIFVPWHITEKVYQRYYYLFTYFELKKLLKKSCFKILYSKPFGKNLIFVVENNKI